MIEKVKKKIWGWSYKWLSKGGRLILVQAVLQQFMVYWAHLYAIPKKILKIDYGTLSVEWRKREGKVPFGEVGVDNEVKGTWGWGLKELHTFERALLMKSMWRGLMSNGIWNDITKNKYLGDLGVEGLLMIGWKNKKGASAIWNGFKM